jgi:acetylornithine aminotransferase/acetylornithine/N-succinyldiaminopimelate aminotransferase
LLHDESPEAVIARESRCMLGTYSRTPFHPRSGEGAQLSDADGSIYWDFLAGIAVNALGYGHPALTRVMEEEGSSLLHTSNLFYHPAPGLLAEKLVEISQMSRVFFCNSGTEANEAAIKLARLANPGRSEIVALNESFHGRSIGALSLTGHEAYRTPFEPLLSDVKFVEPNDVAALQEAVSSKTCAIFLEPIMGEGGIIPLSVEYLQAASRLAHETGALLVCDEIQCGLGRTGDWFAFQHAGILPDIVTLAKPLGGGLPLGAVLTAKSFDGVIKPGMHGTTFGGNPLACRLGLALIEEIEHARLLQHVNAMGELLVAELTELKSRHNSIVEIRGRGLMVGVELTSAAGPVVKELLGRGIVAGTAREKVLRLLPPYIVPKQAIAALITALDEVLGAIDSVESTNEEKQVA